MKKVIIEIPLTKTFHVDELASLAKTYLHLVRKIVLPATFGLEGQRVHDNEQITVRVESYAPSEPRLRAAPSRGFDGP